MDGDEVEEESDLPSRSNLTLADRKSIYFMLKVQEKNGTLPRGAIKSCAQNFPVAPKRIGAVYAEVKKNRNVENGSPNSPSFSAAR